jgi:ParB family chromosome partitioning protein
MSLLATLTASSAVFRVRLADIDATDRLRPVDEAHAQLIAASMNEGRQIQPVVLRVHPSGAGWKLVVGGHRHRGGEILGWEEIDAVAIECSDDEARQIEIDENLARKELTALERAQFLAERKRIYEALHPETAHGKAKKPKKSDPKGKVANLATFLSFAKEAAKQTDLAPRTIRRAVELAGKLSPEVVALIRGSKFADNQAKLQALAALEPEQQLLVAQLVASGFSGTVAKARVVAGIVPEGGAVREEDRPLARLEPIVFRMSRQQLLDLRSMIDNRLAAMEPAKPARATKDGAA